MKKGLIATSITLSLLIAATAYAIGYLELECERNAILLFLDRENAAQAQYYAELLDARYERRTKYAAAMTIADDRQRKDTIKLAEREYKDQLREARNTLKDAEREAKNDYREDKRQCRDDQKNRCVPYQCPQGKVPRCDKEGNPIVYPGDPCGTTSSSSSSRKSSSSSAGYCGDGICTESENAILCPICVPETPPELCRCRRVCEADCGTPTSSRSSSRSSSKSSSSRSSSKSSSRSSSSSSRSICGDGICEGSEDALLCPVCAPGTPPDRCVCRKVCEADCR